MSEDKKTDQVYTMEEVRQHKGARSLWLTIHDDVYDISKFLEEHPGGEEVLLEQGGSYSTDAFEDVGHSADARELMKDYRIGTLATADKESKSSKPNTSPTAPPAENGGSLTTWLIPLGIAIAAALVYRFILSPSS